MLGRAEARDAVTRAWRDFVDRLAGLDRERWEAPTRLTGWTVADLAAHTVWGMSMEAEALRRARAGSGEESDGRHVDVGPPYPELLREVSAARDELVVELDRLVDEPFDAAVPLALVTVPLPVALQILTMEAGAHASDLADANGAERPLTAAEVAATNAVLPGYLLQVGGRGGEDAPEGTVIELRAERSGMRFARTAAGWSADGAGEPTAVVSGDDSSIHLFALGRLPVDDPRLDVTGDAALAARFKAIFPGP